jgi:hypothetical protein
MSEKKIAVIIPAFNEERTIGTVIDGIKKNLPQADVVVVIDKSTDKTALIARQRGATVIRLPIKLGIGCAIETGYKYVYRQDYEYIVKMDADGQHLPAEINKLLAPVVNGKSDVTVGSRYLNGGSNYRTSLVRRGMMAVLASLVSWVYKRRFTDTTSGFKAMNRRAAKLFSENYPSVGGTPALLVLKWGGFCVTEVGVKMEERSAGTSYFTNVRKIAYILRVFVALLALLVK